MRYTKKKYRLKGREGEERTVRRFLFSPVTLDFETRWLEFVGLRQRVVRTSKGYFWKSYKFD